VLDQLTRHLAGSNHLSDEQIHLAVEQLVDESIPAGTKADFLCHLALKGETVQEIAAFAQALREKSIKPPIDPETRCGEILDVCGTGGDRLNTFNISTTVALLCAAAGVTVAKHGNRAITSQAGSADVLEALGVRIDLPPAKAADSLRINHFAFFFAPHYHPAFKHIAPARKLCAERGQRTIFNFLGPLLNPARPTAQLVGVPRPELTEPLARVLMTLGVHRAIVVSGNVASHNSEPGGPKQFLDELSALGENCIAEFYADRVVTSSVMASKYFQLQPASLADLAGSDKHGNAEIVRRILRGEERGPKREAVLLNAAAALFVANRSESLPAAWKLAAQIIDSGQALAKLSSLSS